MLKNIAAEKGNLMKIDAAAHEAPVTYAEQKQNKRKLRKSIEIWKTK